jgi:hypothetical protein
VTPEGAFLAIGRLRKEARDEIDRLIRFLDKTDDYVSRELEDSIDDNPHDEETDDHGRTTRTRTRPNRPWARLRVTTIRPWPGKRDKAEPILNLIQRNPASATRTD